MVCQSCHQAVKKVRTAGQNPVQLTGKLRNFLEWYALGKIIPRFCLKVLSQCRFDFIGEVLITGSRRGLCYGLNSRSAYEKTPTGSLKGL